jgi:hypothetical protein
MHRLCKKSSATVKIAFFCAECKLAFDETLQELKLKCSNCSESALKAVVIAGSCFDKFNVRNIFYFECSKCHTLYNEDLCEFTGYDGVHDLIERNLMKNGYSYGESHNLAYKKEFDMKQKCLIGK